jgi:hypothetical protein
LAEPGGDGTLAHMSEPAVRSRDLLLGLAVSGVRAGAAVGRLALVPVGVAARAPVVGGTVRRAIDGLSEDGRTARTAGLDRLIESVLDDELTERVVDRVLASPGLERMLIQVLESRLVDEMTERVIRSPEMDRIVEYVATSPEVLEAISHHTASMVDEVVEDVRRKSQSVDDFAERTVRGWLRRPRPAST